MNSTLRALPNMITGSRVVLAGIFMFLLLTVEADGLSGAGRRAAEVTKMNWAFILFVVAGLTDIIDGPLARRLGVTSSFGRRFDPLVDKVLICGGFLALKLFFGDSSGLAWWMVAVIWLREIFVTVVRHISESGGTEFAATWAGKLKMFLQSFSIGTIIYYLAHFQDHNWCFILRDVSVWLAVICTIFSAAIYLPRMKHIRFRREK
jgi:CDP-diacylglycerol--glycerol-3-phosphate 3-phosphatidyltransferase